ncbi:hypothetical protein B488_06520 [Liberibacter crescens BT-1]|uniref:Uncharacterized protein n=1 Tax=Liberibacter crescens (strain BT-1) TaxID=1215343 RepID=L0ESZ0_LIBCB|nr:hypothetical protein [Liberibacter crescens]AGA64644.1 hypothetical protein B488_06520 [Liberibacter crescens BT-1]
MILFLDQLRDISILYMLKVPAFCRSLSSVNAMVEAISEIIFMIRKAF